MQARSDIGLGFVVKWLVAVAVGNILMTLILSGIISVLAQVDTNGVSPIILRFVIIVGLSAIAGGVLGSAEAYPLVRYVSQPHPAHWILATSAGLVVGMLGTWLMPNRVLDNLVLGAAVGVFQWLVLRREVLSAGWWVPANLIAFQMAGGPVILGLVLLFLFRKTSATPISETPPALP